MNFRKHKKAVIYSLASITAVFLIFLLKFNTIEESGENLSTLHFIDFKSAYFEDNE